jgi:uncharacterized lipoprotein YddW (UPF0748 family)
VEARALARRSVGEGAHRYTYGMHRLWRPTLLVALLLVCTALDAAPRYRALWVDTFNSPFATKADVDRIIAGATRADANAVFVEVRRRGDAWYLDASEPRAESLASDFDPLRYLIDEAHSRRIEVHAFTIVGAVWHGTTTLPRDPNHVFLQHVWDAQTNTPYADARQWATCTRDGNYRFNNEYYIDLGNPDAAAYTMEVLAHLAASYAIDGIHLDRIRYPENIRGDVGYNAASVARFNERYSRSGTPAPNDPLWCDWRRDQVTNFVRDLHSRLRRIRPAIQLSAALITYGRGPRMSGGFQHTDAYENVFQDWKRWADEGIIDILCPMIYKREANKGQKRDFDDWLHFLVDTARQSNRIAIAGIGAYLNTLPGTLAQTRRAKAAGADGVIYFALARMSDGALTNISRMVR